MGEREPENPSGLEGWKRWVTLATPVVIFVVGIFAWIAGHHGWKGVVFVAAIVIGLFVTLRPRRVVAHTLPPIQDFGSALLPAALPLLAIFISGSSAFPVLIQLVTVPLAILIAWRLIVLPGASDTKSWFARAWKTVSDGVAERHELRHVLLFVALVALVVVGFILLSPHVNPFEARPGDSTNLLAAAVDLWLVAIVLRLFAYGDTIPRLVVALLAIALVIWGASWAGIIGAWDFFDGIGVVLGAAFIVCLIATIELEMATELFPRVKRVLDRFKVNQTWSRALGYSLSIAAAIAVVLAALASWNEVRQTSKAEVRGGGENPSELIPRVGQSNRELGSRFSPTMVFTNDERWWPVQVTGFARDPRAELLGNYVVPTDHPPATLPKRCPNLVKPPCFNLTIHCELPDDCVDPPGHPGKAVYVRVLRRGHPEAKRGPDPFAVDAGPYNQQTAVIVQYWFFYRYNDWVRPVLTGKLSERHEGDWEAITIGLGKKRPLYAAYSAHCGGNWRDWDDVRVSDVPREPRLHPIVAVAEGSHANYFETQDRRSPDWAGCANRLPDGAATLISYASNIRDETEDGPTWRPLGNQLIILKRHKWPMSFVGTWGEDTRTFLTNRRPHKLQVTPGGPATPSLQLLWTDPLLAIFHSEHWHGP